MRSLLLSISFLFSAVSFGQWKNSEINENFPEESSAAAMNVKGAVWRIVEKHFDTDDDGDKNKNPNRIIIYSFDEKGTLIQKDDWQDNYIGHNVYTYTYDNLGRVTEIKNSKQSYGTNSFRYSKSGNTLTIISGNDSRRLIKYNSNGTISEILDYNREDSDSYSSRAIFSYASGTLISEIRRDGGVGYYDMKYTIEYDQQGNPAKTTDYDVKDREVEETTTFKYKYDKQSNWTSRKQAVTYGTDSEKSYYIIERSIEYR
jgi:hypothetical protein